MNLVKWFRKNRNKVMAIVVIVLMVGFIGGSALTELLRPSRTGRRKTVAYFADDRRITTYDLALARHELDVLKLLRADILLRTIGDPVMRSQDLRALLLSELLFSEQRISPALPNHIRRTVLLNQYRMSDKQINDIYRRKYPGNIYWFLLREEAQLAGVRVPNEDSGRLLARMIPQLYDGATYSQLIGSLVNQRGLSEKEILTAFSELLAVLEYAKMICSGEYFTISQIRHGVSWASETIDAEFVEFDSAVFAKALPEPNEQTMLEHFNKYKQFFPGTITEQNPYGFGYKLPDRVQLEYIAIELDDISAIVKPPTQEEAEEYYRRNRDLFTEKVLSDPNDPNSPSIDRTQTYAEVAGTIKETVLKERINAKAAEILQQARTLTEPNLAGTDLELATLTSEQYEQMAGDYKTAAGRLSKEYKIKIYSGRTGLLGAADMQADEHLGKMYLESYGDRYNPIGLVQIAFAVEPLQASELGPFDVQRPKMYENMGTIRTIENEAAQIVAIMRVIAAERAVEPEGIDQAFSTKTLALEQAQDQVSRDDPNLAPDANSDTPKIYSIREKVIEGLKKLAAMDTTKSKAEEFIDLVATDPNYGWDIANRKFNELYGQQAKADPNDPDIFELQYLTNRQRISAKTIETLATQAAGKPATRLFVNEAQQWLSVDEANVERQFIDRLYSLVPQDSNSIETTPLIMEFRPTMSYYVIKNVSVRRVDQAQYARIKPLQVYREEHTQSQSLAAVYFNPEGIVKRLDFRLLDEEQPAAANEPPKSQGAS